VVILTDSGCRPQSRGGEMVVPFPLVTE
jgi:hypothetical protein